jgi:error-prone DNA polymerase
MAYVELHARSAFSFLEGASIPEALAGMCAEHGMSAMALLDRDGVYGAPRVHLAAVKEKIKAHIGAEVTVRGSKTFRLPLLVASRTGYQNLCRLITRYKFREKKKGTGAASLDEVAEHAEGLICLTGDKDGPLAKALLGGGPERARRELERLMSIFGPANVFIELQRHFDRAEEARNQAAASLAQSLRLPIVATNGVQYTTAAEREILDVFTCIRNHCSLDTAGKLLAKNSEHILRAPREMEELFRDLPEAISNTQELSLRLEFTLDKLGYEFPRYPVPAGETMMSFLRKRTMEGAEQRYRPLHERARRQLERELELIERLDLPGYFLIVWDIVRYCNENGILIQGRGSAANSVVCYSLGITAIDPVGMDLLFERFLSEERGEWPDIDLDLPSGDQREQAIQYIYQRYGQLGAAMTANVITYRGRSAAREVGKSLGFDNETIDRLSKLAGSWEWKGPEDTLENHFQQAGFDLRHPRIYKYLDLCLRMQDLPRHLGQHSGGMVICQGQLDSIVPLEPATMPGRVVVQWDKDDCADMGIIKVDLLGLGMMAVLKDSIALIRKHHGEEVDLAHLPPDDPLVYSAIQKADTVGMFQIESRAQMSCLPRNRPEKFYDLVVQVAIIRPGPIVGNMVNPYLKRRQGKEPVTYPHPALEPVLARTLGVPLFQEQLLRMAMIAARFSGGEAEELRRAFGFKRSERRMQEVEAKLRAGMESNGITGKAQDEIVQSITSFALYGFPESHAASFALIAYASAYLKSYYLAAFTAATLNNQPMGFYSPATIVKDAQRHGLKVRPVDIMKSEYLCTLEPCENTFALRLGLNYTRGLREVAAKAIVQERARAPFTSVDDLTKRVPELRRDEVVKLAQIGALNNIAAATSKKVLHMHRRDALWQAERAARFPGPLLQQITEKETNSPLRQMTSEERLVADFDGTGMTVGPHPMQYRRAELNAMRVRRAADLPQLPNGIQVRIAGNVIARQRPGTAKGFIFLSLEDETGISNAIITPDLYENNRLTIHETFLMIEGTLQNLENVISVKASKVVPLPISAAKTPSHDFH